MRRAHFRGIYRDPYFEKTAYIRHNTWISQNVDSAKALHGIKSREYTKHSQNWNFRNISGHDRETGINTAMRSCSVVNFIISVSYFKFQYSIKLMMSYVFS